MSSHVLRVALNHDIIGIGQITCPQCRVVSDVPAGINEKFSLIIESWF